MKVLFSKVRLAVSPEINALATILVALVAIAMYVPFLAGWELWYPDEPDIGEVAVAMYESGDWVAPRRMGVIWVDYPPLLYWVGVASSHLTGGVSAFSLRLPNALAAVALEHDVKLKKDSSAWASVAGLVPAKTAAGVSTTVDYFDADGNTTATLTDIRSVGISLTAEAPAGRDGTVERTYTTRVRCRNLSLP